VGECSFWYRPTRVVPDQRPLNGRCCSVGQKLQDGLTLKTVHGLGVCAGIYTTVDKQFMLTFILRVTCNKNLCYIMHLVAIKVFALCLFFSLEPLQAQLFTLQCSFY